MFKTTKRGYTLLFAVLTASLVLGVVAFVAGITRKQYALTVTARESLFSVYAADSAMSCAMKQLGSYSSTTPPNIICNTATLSATQSNTYQPSLPSYTQTQSWTYGPYPLTSDGAQTDGYPCALLYFVTALDPSGSPVTIVDARGYNSCKTIASTYGPDTTSVNTVERALRYVQGGVW